MRRLLQSSLAVCLGLSAGLVVTWFAGENPWHVLQILAKGAFGSRADVGMTLFYSTPLIFTGLSVAVAFHAGLFNIGAEGQLTLCSLPDAGFTHRAGPGGTRRPFGRGGLGRDSRLVTRQTRQSRGD